MPAAKAKVPVKKALKTQGSDFVKRMAAARAAKSKTRAAPAKKPTARKPAAPAKRAAPKTTRKAPAKRR